MDSVNSVTNNHVNSSGGAEIIRSLEKNSMEIYTDIINSQDSVFTNSVKNNMSYEIEENTLSIENDYQAALKCLNNLEKEPRDSLQDIQKNICFANEKHFDVNNAIASTSDTQDKGTVIKIENINSFKTTDDECMAVEALRQLGGMYNNVVTEKDLPPLTCNICEREFNTTVDLHAHYATCKEELTSFTCANCQKVFDNKQEFNAHSCYLQEMFSCKFCNQNFFCDNDLQAHISNLHLTDRPYRCHICNTTFPKATSLKNHLKIHTYIPGRALFNYVNDQQTSPTESETLKWPSEQLVYVEKNSDSLHTFNYSAATCLVQAELNQDVNLSVGQEMVVNTSYDDSSENSLLECPSSSVDKTLNYSYQNDLNYVPPIKMESVPFLTEVDKMDEAYPISSIPQMEVTIGTNHKRPHVCSHCGATFTRAKALSSHEKLHLIGWRDKYECDSCGETFETEQLRLNHKDNCLLNNTLLTNTSEKKLDTENPQTAKVVCNPDIKKKNDIKPLIIEGKHSCPECEKKFTTKQKMFRHMWIHRKKTFACEMCTLTFDQQAELDKHRLSQHPMDSPYVCQDCGKCFASRQGLWEHGRVHGSGAAGLFQCTTCTKTFASRQGYLIHNRTHTGERPYGCRFCMKAFRDGGTLRKHERIHTGERPHVCPICMHDFNQKVVLREHVRWVHVASKIENSKGVFECQLCHFNIQDKEELCAHIVRHSDQMAAQAKGLTRTKNLGVKTGRKSSKRGTRKVIKEEIINESEDSQNEMDSSTVVTECATDVTQLAELLSEDNNFECDMCGSNFPTQKELTNHVRIHI